MKTLSAMPFIRLLLPFTAGIVAAIWVDKLAWGLAALAGALLSYPLLFALSQRRWPFAWRWVFGVGASFWLAALGYGLAVLENEMHAPRHFHLQLRDTHHGVAIVQRVQAQSGGYRLQTRVLAIGVPQLKSCNGRLLISLRDSTADLQPGDTLVFRRALIRRIAPPYNPGVFDFSRYWHYRNFHYQTIIGTGQWQILGKGRKKNLLQLAEQSRNHCVSLLRQYLPTDHEWAVGCALLLGAKDAMTDEVTQAYSRTGAMHALAVSGMHVAIVWLALAWLLYPLKLLGRPGKYLSAGLLIVGVWAYAIFTGASPSALRSATMVAFLILGQSFHRRHITFNTLAASAFVLLCHYPYLLMDLGFQLSYLAVAGILLFERPIYLCWIPGLRWVDYLWRLTSVSIAAQLATFPISLYYFHQFPFYFWLSGWVVVPAATLLLYWGGVLLALHPFTALASLVGQGFYRIIWVVNKAVFGISELPGAVAEQVWIGAAGVVALHLALLMLAFGIISRKGKWLLWMGIFLLVACADRCHLHWKAARQRKLVVYHLPRATAVNLFQGRTAMSFASLPADHPTLRKTVAGCRGKHLINTVADIPFDTAAPKTTGGEGRLLRFFEVSLVIIDSSYQKGTVVEPRQADYLLLSGNPAIEIDELLSSFSCRQGIIADASNSFRRVEKWKAHCRQAGVVFIDVKNAGAFERHF